MKRRIATFARGGWYPRGAARLEASLQKHGWDGEFQIYTDEEELGMPRHEVLPYAFKVGIMRKAIEEGVDEFLWLDASCYATRSVEPIFNEIDRFGYFILAADQAGEEHPIGAWVNDRTLAYFGVSRFQMMRKIQQSTICMGWSLTPEFIEEWFLPWQRSVEYFAGRWDNNSLSESTSHLCRGHRHDQSVAALISHNMGLSIYPRDNHLFSYDSNPNPQATVCILAGGL